MSDVQTEKKGQPDRVLLEGPHSRKRNEFLPRALQGGRPRNNWLSLGKWR